MLPRSLHHAAALLLAAPCIAACDTHNDLLFGRVESTLDEHVVVVTDCYRTRVPPPETTVDGDAAQVHRWAPCRDAVVVLRGDQLDVNGRSYGAIAPGDSVVVDHGRVSVRPRDRATAAVLR